MNRGVLKPDDNFEEFANTVIDHFATEERIYGRLLDHRRTYKIKTFLNGVYGQ